MPVLDNMVQTFDSPGIESKRTDFWGKICHHEFEGSGSSFMSGWITAFCFWNEKGELNKHRRHGLEPFLSSSANVFDSSIYPRINTYHRTNGFMSVPVKVDDNGKIYSTRMVGGSVGLHWTRSSYSLEKSLSRQDHKLFCGNVAIGTKRVRSAGGMGLDTVKPALGWWMYDLHEDKT